MKYEFEWNEMTDREQYHWKQLIKERQVNVETGLTYSPNHQFVLKVSGNESIRYLRLVEKIRNNYPFIDLKKEKLRDPMPRITEMPDEPIVVVKYSTDNYHIWVKDVSSAKPLIDLIYNADLQVVNRYGYPELGRHVLKQQMEETAKYTAKVQEEKRLRSM